MLLYDYFFGFPAGNSDIYAVSRIDNFHALKVEEYCVFFRGFLHFSYSRRHIGIDYVFVCGGLLGIVVGIESEGAGALLKCYEIPANLIKIYD